jgi:UDP-N-acetylmuramate--alanine ligase
MVANGARTAGRVPVLAERDALAARVAEAVRPGDVVLTLGAGDITQVGRDLLGLLQQRAAGRERVG